MSEFTSDANSNKKSAPRDKLYTRWGQLKSERATWIPHYKEISDYLLPRNGRFFIQDRDKGQRRHNNIYDSTGTRSLRVLAAGMMAGMTSPARPWFRLGVGDPELMKYAPVKVWLNEVTQLMLQIYSRGNTYRALHGMYEELGAFGTAPSIVMPDYNDVIRHYPSTCGEYAIACDYRGTVNTIYREFQKTVGELVGEFGYDNCSKTVKNLHDRGTLDAWVTIVHAIEPRVDRDPRMKDAKNMPFKSCYFELNSDKQQYLRESGFKMFPALAPRWATAGGDIYGNSPAMEALGDIKQLQHEQLRKAQAIDLKTRPPLQVPSSMKNRDVETLAGGISFVDMAGPTGGIKTAYEVNLDLNHLLMDIGDVRERIRGSFYADLFLMLANQTDTRMTATEVAERHEEKLLMLGPVLERLHNELLSPMIDITFNKMVKAGVLPPPPPELQGDNLNVEFVSTLAQAQRAVAVGSMDRFVNTIGMVAAVKPEILDKLDADQYADVLADALGIDPSLVVADDKVAIIRQQRAQAQAKAAQAEQAPVMAQTAKTLADTDTTGQNGLTDLMAGLQGYS